jgi:hypothetical protein
VLQVLAVLCACGWPSRKGAGGCGCGTGGEGSCFLTCVSSELTRQWNPLMYNVPAQVFQTASLTAPLPRLLIGLDEIGRQRRWIATAAEKQPGIATRRGYSMLRQHQIKWAPRSEARTHRKNTALLLATASKSFVKEELKYASECWRGYARDRTQRRANKKRGASHYECVSSAEGTRDWHAFVARMHRQAASLHAMKQYHKGTTLRQWDIKHCRHK